MVRVLILAAPFKIHFFERMTRYFPSEFDHRILPIDMCYGRRPPIGRWGADKPWLLPSKGMLDEMLDFRPDLTYTDYPMYPSWYNKICSMLQGRRVPLIVNLRGDWWREYFDYRTQLNPLHKLASLYYFFFWSTGIEFSDFIIPICKWLEKIVNDRLPSIPTSVIYQGVDVDPWVTDRNGDLGLKKPAVGILQDHNVRLKVRGLLWFSNVIRKMSDVNFHIAGGGPYTQKVEEALGNFKNVHLMGRLPYPDGVRKFHRSCDLYVLPSGLDCCPTTLLEASLCGKAVIASRIGGIPELVVENETGWTLPNENPADWIDKIRLLINDGRLARKMGDQGRKFVAENFSWRRVSLAVVDIMRKVLG